MCVLYALSQGHGLQACVRNVSAIEKSTGKSNKLTLSNETGRFSAADMQQLVQAAWCLVVDTLLLTLRQQFHQRHTLG